jgi:hypothetical protein
MDQSICCGNVPVMSISSAEPRYFVFKEPESILNIREEAVTQAVKHKLIYFCVSEPPRTNKKIFKHLP